MGGSIILLMLLFPPYYVKYGSVIENVGYGFILNPPKFGSIKAMVNTKMLMTQWIGVLILTSLLVIVLKDWPTRKKLQSDTHYSQTHIPNGIEQILEKRINNYLKWGFVFSLVWMFGLGSAISIFCGWKAQRLSKQLSYPYPFRWVIWWCYIVGGAGILLFWPIWIKGILQ